MTMRELGTLETVRLTDIWRDEPSFTQWLARNLSYLQPAMNLELELVQAEHRVSGAGQADILAQDVKSGRKVVIENQFNPSDNDHFARLVGYAASREARILIWIAPEFYRWHSDMLVWLNSAEIDVFGVRVCAYRIGNAYAPHFEIVASPDDSANLVDARSEGGPSIFARFYRPLTAALRGEGIFAIGGRQGGWTGRYRRYRSGTLLEDAEITYQSTLGRGTEQCLAGLRLAGSEQSDIYDSLRAHVSEFRDAMGEIEIMWQKGERESWVWTNAAAIPNEDEESLEATRKWMRETLVRFRDVFEPKLVEIISGDEVPGSETQEES